MVLAQRDPGLEDTRVLEPRHHPKNHLLFFQLFLAADLRVARGQPGVILGLDDGAAAEPLLVPVASLGCLSVFLRQLKQSPLEVREIVLAHPFH